MQWSSMNGYAVYYQNNAQARMTKFGGRMLHIFQLVLTAAKVS